MYMARQPTPPLENTPALLLKIAEQFADPEWLKALADAAQAITKANELTDEEVENLADAILTIDRAAKIDAQLIKRAELLDVREHDLEAREQEVTNRELQCDNRNTHLAEQKQDHNAARDWLSKREELLVTGQKELAFGQAALEDAQTALKRREEMVKEREDILNNAQAMVAGKKSVRG